MKTADLIQVTGWYVVRTTTGFNTIVRLVRDDSFRSLEIVDGPFAYRLDADAALKERGAVIFKLKLIHNITTLSYEYQIQTSKDAQA